MNTRKRYYMRNKENQKRWAKLDFNQKRARILPPLRW